MKPTLTDIQNILANGSFHHATYRNHGTLWEGLYVYVKDNDGMRGFRPELCFDRNHPDLIEAYDMLRHTGISVGAYGEG
jgi:hypothetical protein